MADAIIVFPPGFRLLDSDGNPVAGGYYEFYAAGTSTPKTMYSDAALSTSLGSTVYCDSGGYTVTTQGGSTKCNVFTGTAAYKIIAKDSSATTLWTHDNLRGASDLSIYSTASATNNEATIAKSANYTVVSGDGYKSIVCTQSGGAFTLTLPSALTVGDGWWVKVLLKSPASSNAVTLATVSSQTISSHAAAGTSLVLIGGGAGGLIKSDGANWLWEPNQTAGGNFHIETTIASATTTDIGASNSDTVAISGTTTITSFGSVANAVRLVRFTGALTLTHNATSLILPDAANITTVAGDTAIFASDSSGNWRCWSYQLLRATQAVQETGTSTAAVVTPGRQHYHPGHPKGWGDFTAVGGTINASHNLSSVTDNGTGDQSENLTTAFSSANYATNKSSALAGASIANEGDASRTASVSRTVTRSTAGAAADANRYNTSFFGDQ